MSDKTKKTTITGAVITATAFYALANKSEKSHKIGTWKGWGRHVLTSKFENMRKFSGQELLSTNHPWQRDFVAMDWAHVEKLDTAAKEQAAQEAAAQELKLANIKAEAREIQAKKTTEDTTAEKPKRARKSPAKSEDTTEKTPKTTRTRKTTTATAV